MTPAEITGAYEKETGAVIIETFQNRRAAFAAVPGVVVANHGPFTWGKDAQDAVHNAVVLEEVARMAFGVFQLNQSMIGIRQELLDKHYLRKHGKGAYYGQGPSK